MMPMPPSMIGTGHMRVTLVATLAGVSMMAAWPGHAGQADHENPQQVARGAEVYVAYCASCHGTNLEGQPNWRSRKPDGRLPAPPHDETGHGTAAHAPAGYLTDMPGFGDVLSDDEIWSVLAYIKSRWPKHITARRQAAIREKVK